MASEIPNSELLSKFRGCMIGSLIGDCLGAPFEFDPPRTSKIVLENHLSNLLNGGSIQIFPFTDDTCMTLSVARSLIKYKKVNSKDLAKRFVDEYFKEPQRGYGMHVVDVFEASKETNFKDIFLPAKKQFSSSGSYGNGAAMRIAPIALFGHYKTDKYLKRDVEECSRITHHHPNGYNGAILQCLAVKAALKSDSSKEFDPVDFIRQLKKKMEAIEVKDDSPFCESLKNIEEIYLQDQEDISANEIAERLGNDVSASKSVPTAIYSFLRGMKPISEFECLNPFARTIYFAISVGGDTDTIAGMAGSIAGAYYGIGAIPTELQERCEFKDEVDNLAHKLYAASQEMTSCNIG
ncbi:unnamed protein product [Larinioides sclopetarius]|uniref:ADP-ribosylhydrolase ARH3 n=1 Tax=Larinioides sclopetarius TaxID=280406 RepID=A0AAV2A6J8_9ARAC